MKSLLTKIFFLSPFLFSVTLFAQTTGEAEDEKRYVQYTKPALDSAHNAFRLWQNVRDGYLKDFNADSLLSVYQLLAFQQRLRQLEFIEQNPNSSVSLKYFERYFVNSPYYKVDSLLSIYGYFSERLKATPLGKAIAGKLLKKQTLAIGKIMPDFSFKTNSGKAIDLASFLSSKYVLLSFWDAGCRPCIRNIPLLKTIYQEYNHKGLEIVSVSIDNVEKTWLTALDRYKMPWLQTCDLAAYIKGNNKLRDVYDIKFIPQYFLIDKKGKLIYQNVLLDEKDDYALLQAILHKELN